MRKKTASAILVSCLLGTSLSFSQRTDSVSFHLVPRQSFCSYENETEVLLHIPAAFANTSVSLTISSEGIQDISWKGIPGKKYIAFKIPLTGAPRNVKVKAVISVAARQGTEYIASAKISKLAYKPNEVKTDNLTGSLIVNRKIFFPFGFYCYSPVHPTLPEEEIVKGFNMISPYQKILPETVAERKAYMDRCAQLGMKVHYNLLSVAGGGGVSSKTDGLTDQQKRDLLLNEVKSFMDHPALLAWYISDEPNGYKIPPTVLEEIYDVIKSIDPWHPVSMVFMAPFSDALRYEKAFDIAMADPYPVPVKPVTVTGDAATRLKADFEGKKPVWIVPQAFGGGEWWEREPTQQELRSMTWQAIIRGATGIQYFVRQGMNYFPKSTATWAECGRMATEAAFLAPWLLSSEDNPAAQSSSPNIICSARKRNGSVLVMAVSTVNEYLSSSIKVAGLASGKARVLFENRTVSFASGTLKDQVAPFGTKFYLVEKPEGKDIMNTASVNLIKDPGFEDLTTPGIPSACYARAGGDRGSTYFLDTRESVDGYSSLRLITPLENLGAGVRFYPVSVKAGKSYAISLWAKADPEQHFNAEISKKQLPQYAEIQFGSFKRARFVPDAKWREYVTFVTIPSDTTATVRTNLLLRMPGQGVGWFDVVKVIEEK